MNDLVKTYNPANAAALTAEQIAGLQKLSIDEIKQLAQAYPNGTFNSGYLLIIDSSKPVQKQIPTLSTFQNLFNLRTKNGFKNYVAYNFRANHKVVNIQATVKPKRSQVVDLSDVELLELPGFKMKNEAIQPSKVEVVKINPPESSELILAPKPKRGRPKTKIQ